MVPPGTNVVPEPPVLVGGQDSGHYNVPTWLIICNMRVSLNKRHCKPLLLLREECEVLHLLPDHGQGGVIRIGEFYPGQKAAVISGGLS